MRSILLIFLSLAVPGREAAAADIAVLRADGGGAVILLTGEILEADGDRFAEAASQRERATVVFSSPGGNLLAGLRIGQLIRLHDFTTLVPAGQRCASACALAWLGGTRRTMEPDAMIGFHEAYVRDRGGRPQVSGLGNALIGAYLSRLGLTDEAILYIEAARPDEVTWLTERAALTYGIALSVTPAPASAPPAPAAPAPAGHTAEETARLFSATYFTHWSETNGDALAFFAGAYAARVTFYGTAIGRGAVVDQKRRFAERWPERVYAVRNDSVRSRCEGDVCAVAGVVDWDARASGGAARTTGSANFRLDLAMRGARPLIIAETGSVISRGEPESRNDTAAAGTRASDAKAIP